MIRLAVIRHGRTEWNRDGKIQGHRDIPLEPDAIKELTTYRLPDEWQDAINSCARLIARRKCPLPSKWVTTTSMFIVPSVTSVDRIKKLHASLLHPEVSQRPCELT